MGGVVCGRAGVRSTQRFGWDLSVHVENLGSLVFGAAAHVFYALCFVQCHGVATLSFSCLGLV